MDRPTFATRAYDCVLGVDVGKLSHWACAVSPGGEELLSRPVANTEPEFDALLAGLPARTLVVVDQRRNIGALVIRRARAAGMDVAYLPGIVEHKVAEALPGIAKTDSVDADIIATTALGMPRMLRPVPEEDPALEAVRIMAAERASLLRDRTACVNALRARLLESCPTFEAACDFSRPWLAASLAEAGGPWDVLVAGRRSWSARVRRHGGTAGEARRSLDAVSGTRPDEAVVAAEGLYVRGFASRIAEDAVPVAALDAEIARALAGDEGYRDLLTVPGIGPKTAAQLVTSVDVSDLGSHDQLASYCGLTPATQQSGTSVHYDKAQRGGNKQPENLLIFSCCFASM